MTRTVHNREFEKSGIKQATPLNGYHQRKPRTARPTVANPRAALPSIDDLAGAPEPVIDALRQWYDLVERERTHLRAEATANADAKQAAEDYRHAVRAAIAAGEDPGKVKDATAKHQATAAAHKEFGRIASAELIRHGHTLGTILSEHADAITAVADQQLNDAEARVRIALDALGETWADWSNAFGLRQWISYLAMGTETVPVYHGGKSQRTAIAAATETIAGLLAEPEKLRADEDNVRAWRATQR